MLRRFLKTSSKDQAKAAADLRTMMSDLDAIATSLREVGLSWKEIHAVLGPAKTSMRQDERHRWETWSKVRKQLIDLMPSPAGH